MLQWKVLPFSFVRFCLREGFEIKDTIEQILQLYRGQSLCFSPRRRKRTLDQSRTLQGFKNAFYAGTLVVSEVARDERQLAFFKQLKTKTYYKANLSEKVTQKELNEALNWFMKNFITKDER